MSFFSEAISVLASFGFYDFFLPWLLSLAVVFGVLENKKYISEQTAVNAAIAIAISFLGTVVLHGFYITFYTYFNIVLAGLLALVIFAAMFDIKPKELIKDAKEWNKNAIPGLLIVATAIIFFLALGYSTNDLFSFLNTPLFSLIILAVVLAIVVSFMAGKGHGSDDGHGH